MQKIFIIRNYPLYDSDIDKVHNFIGDQGKIITVSSNHTFDQKREFGSWLVVADDGK